jgi:ribosomal protein L11 methyltransferase
MPWTKVSLDTTQEAVDWVCTLLATANYLDEVQIQKYSAEPSQDSSQRSDPHPEEPQPEWVFTVSCYLLDGTNARIEEITNLFSPLYRSGLTTLPEITTIAQKPIDSSTTPSTTLDDSAHLHRIGQRFVVLAPHVLYPAEQENDILIRLKASSTFGSGLHPTTIITLQLLERHLLPHFNTLDLGTGSGILSVAMAKMGARVLALDNDPIAVQSTQDAIARNGVADRVTVLEGSLGQGSTLGHWMGGNVASHISTVQPQNSFDLIVANIFARIQIALAQDLQQALRRTSAHPGILISSGFNVDYEADVTRALEAVGFEAIDSASIEEWVGLAYQLN